MLVGDHFEPRPNSCALCPSGSVTEMPTSGDLKSEESISCSHGIP